MTKKTGKSTKAEKYKPSEWNIAASDDRGHNVKMVFNVQPFIAKQCEIFLQSKCFPYDSLSALLRHAVYEHCKKLGSLEGEVKTVMGQAKAINTLLDEEQQYAEFSATFAKLSTMVSKHLGTKDRHQAVKIVTDIRRYIDVMPDGFWKRKYLKELDDNYSGLIDEVIHDSKTSMTDFGEEEE